MTFKETERLIVDYFETAGCDVVQMDLEWFLSLYDEGPAISLTALAVALTPAKSGCICQDQHRRGRCTEPGCPYAMTSDQRG